MTTTNPTSSCPTAPGQFYRPVGVQRCRWESQFQIIPLSRADPSDRLSWPGHSDETAKLTAVFLNFFDEIAIDPDIKFAAIALRRTYRLKLPDAIIAATALHLEVPLITRNVKDFKNISDLKLINPFEETS